jgi:acetolactate synthase I/II/III large subunit
MARITGGELLVKCLGNEGVTKLFGIPGGQLTTIVDAVARVGDQQGVEWVLTRHETACANMADAWHRVTGKLAACTATVGCGASNMVAGVETAMSDNIPLIAITPQIHTDRSYPFRGSEQQCDHMTMYSSVTKWNALVNRWDRIPDLVSMAVKQALTGKPGPVHLDIPVDVLFETGEEADAGIIPPARKSRAWSRPHGDPELIEKAAEMLVKAERPLLHAGAGIFRSEAWDEVRQLAEYLCMPVLPTVFSRGVIPETHPLSLLPSNRGGLFAGTHSDVVLAVACTFSELDNWGRPEHWATPAVQKVIQVDIQPTQIALNREVDLGIVGDAKAVLGQLLEAVQSLTGQVESRRFTEDVLAVEKGVRDEVQASLKNDSTPIHPLRLAKEASDFFGEEAIVSLDGGNMGLWGALGATVYGARRFLWPGGSGHLGTGLPFALAAKMAEPDRPVYVLHGDGSFMFTLMELETAARLNLPVIDIVANDGSYSMIKGAQDFAFGARYCGVDFMSLHLDEVARSMGCFGKRITSPAEIKPALEEAVASGRPALIDAVIDCEANLIPPGLKPIVGIWLQGCEGCG